MARQAAVGLLGYYVLARTKVLYKDFYGTDPTIDATADAILSKREAWRALPRIYDASTSNRMAIVLMVICAISGFCVGVALSVATMLAYHIA